MREAKDDMGKHDRRLIGHSDRKGHDMGWGNFFAKAWKSVKEVIVPNGKSFPPKGRDTTIFLNADTTNQTITLQGRNRRLEIDGAMFAFLVLWASSRGWIPPESWVSNGAMGRPEVGWCLTNAQAAGLARILPAKESSGRGASDESWERIKEFRLLCGEGGFRVVDVV